MSTEPGSSAPTIAGLLAIARVEFQHAFSARPAAAAAAPGRVNLIGDHVDYCGGLVLPIAINRHTVVCAGVSPSRGHAGTMRVVSHGRPGVHRVAAAAACASIEPYWVRYPAGVLAMLRDRGLLAVEVGVDLAIASSVPEGAGLSSSAALEVATCLAIEQLARGPGLDSRGRALLAQSAEHEYAGVPCGIMDQYVAVFAREGAALLIDCESLTHRHVHVPEGVKI